MASVAAPYIILSQLWHSFINTLQSLLHLAALLSGLLEVPNYSTYTLLHVRALFLRSPWNSHAQTTEKSASRDPFIRTRQLIKRRPLSRAAGKCRLSTSSENMQFPQVKSILNWFLLYLTGLWVPLSVIYRFLSLSLLESSCKSNSWRYGGGYGRTRIHFPAEKHKKWAQWEESRRETLTKVCAPDLAVLQEHICLITIAPACLIDVNKQCS